MKLKVDDQGHAILQDGNPIYIHDDGKEIPFDANQAFDKIKALGQECKDWRLKHEKAEERLKTFEGIEDPKSAIEAVKIVKNLDQKKLMDAGEVEKVKAEVQKAMQLKLEEKDKELASKDALLMKELIGGRFARSNFIKEKLIIPTDLVESKFGSAFKIMDGRVIAFDAQGNQVYSKERPGEPAEFEEALAYLVEAYPNRDSILKGSSAAGAGMQQQKGQHRQEPDWHKLTPVERINAARAAGMK